jgi:hypothetical protein
MTSEQLLERYRRQAEGIKAAVLREVTRLWPTLDPEDLRGSWPTLLRALQGLAQDARADVARSARTYLNAIALLEGRAGEMEVLLSSAADPAALRTSLSVTGPVVVQASLNNGAAPEVATARALVAVSGSLGRHVLDGGRQTVIDSAEAGRIRWMRVTRGKTCWFCVMLASRGPVYTSAARAGDPRGRPARFHDHCDCQIVPKFERTPIPESTQRYGELWETSTAGMSGADARTAFRIAYEATL